MSSYPIVELFPDSSGNDCGYCSGQDTSISTGMWAHSLGVEDYQDLINRNWRRSGKYCYQPQMKKTCCPQYMIRCDATQFKPTKNQRRVIKKFNRYMMTGSVGTDDANTTGAKKSVSSGPAEEKAERADTNVSKSTASAPAQPKKGAGADPTKPKALKAKQLRLLRKQEKLQNKSSNSTPEAVTERGANNQTKAAGGGESAAKTLAQLINEYDPVNAKHKFEMRLVQSNPRSAEFEATVDEELIVYQKYQVAVHKDPITKVHMEQFKRFLIDSPLKVEKQKGVTLGSFHYQYLLDGKIIAVEIMDILPQFISSKYFIYDPAYEFLTLGTYSTLRSIYYVQQLQEKLRSLKYYLMGYYIHHCPKMRYKGEFSSSYLLCPETYIWTPIEQCTPKLDVSKYSRFCADPNQEDIDKVNDSTLDNTVVLYNRQIMTYSQLRTLKSSRSDKEEVQQYTRLVGKDLSMRILLYRDY